MILLGLLSSFMIGLIILPLLSKKNVRQSVSNMINARHLKKEGTPTMGGLIFLIASLLIILLLYIFKKISFNDSIIIILLTYLFYTIIGYIDDYLKVIKKNNNGLSVIKKLILQSIFAIIIFYLYKLNIGNMNLIIKDFKINLGFLYGFLIFFYLVGYSNAVNITDGLDGLAAGLGCICFLTLGIIAIKQNYLISLFCFLQVGTLLGFLIFNFYPAKIFMGDLGSLSIGATLAIVSIILKRELLFLIISLIFIIEILSSFIQIISIKYFHKRIFKKSPLHHHYEEKGYDELSIVKTFYIINIIVNLIALIIEY